MKPTSRNNDYLRSDDGHTHIHSPIPLIDSALPIGWAEWKSSAQFPAFCLFTDEEIRRTPSPLTWFIKFSPDIQHSPFPTVTLTSPLVIGNIDMSVGNSSKKNLREHYPIIKDNRNPTKSVADLFALFSQMLNKLYSVAVGILLKWCKVCFWLEKYPRYDCQVFENV